MSQEVFAQPARQIAPPAMAQLGHGPIDAKAPCPPGQRPEIPHVEPKPAPKPELPKPEHHGQDKNPCPPKGETQPPKVEIPTPKPPKVETPHQQPPTDKTPCPPKVETPPPPPKVEIPPPVAPPPPKVEVPPPVAPPPPKVEVPPPVAPPRVEVPPRVDTPRAVSVRYSPPAEPIKAFKPTDHVAPPQKEKIVVPGTITIEKTTGAAAIVRKEVHHDEAVKHVPPQTGKVEVHVQKREAGQVKVAIADHGHAKGDKPAAKPHPAKVHPAQIHTADSHARGAVEIKEHAKTKVIVAQEAGAPPVVEAIKKDETITTVAVASSEKTTIQFSPPAAAEVETPGQASKGSNVWGEASVSYSPSTKSTVGTATVGKFFDQQNYGYVQGTADLTRGKMGNVSAMYGHSVLTPYDENGQPRRGNVNVEAGVVLNTGESLEGSKLPIFGKTAARVGVNGYYNLDQEGKTTVYGSADYASNPKQADAQVGISHKLTSDVTVSGGYQVSKVEGYKAGHYATTAASMKISENTELYVGAAVSLQKQNKDNKVYGGVRFSF